MERFFIEIPGVAARFPLLACVLSAFTVCGITRMDYPDADTVVIDDSTRVEYFADGTYTVENDEKILALTEKGRRALRTVTVGVSRRYGDAEIVKIEIIGTNGVVRAVDFRRTLKEATDNSSTSSNIYDPLDRKISCAVSGMEVGETRRVVTRERMLKPRMRDAFAFGAMFEALRPIVRSSLEIVQPKERPIVNVKLRHPIDGTVVHSDDEMLSDGRKVLRWTASNVPQAFPEPDMPSFGSVAQTLLVSTSKSWEDVSKWYWGLCRPRLEATNEAMTNKVSEIVKGLDGGREKVRAIFKFVSQEIRYMGLTLEDESPGYAPHDVSLTFDNRYGVCRDKAALLVSMFRIAGFNAYPVLIRVGPKMDEDVPLPYFNHAIVAVETPSGMEGGELTLMDPTNENTRDLLPAYLMDCSYLVAHPEGRPLAVVPVTPAEKNAFRATTRGSLEPDGSAFVETSATFGGANDLFRGSFVKRTPRERRRAFEGLVRSSYPGAEMLSFEMTPADLRNTDEPLAVKFTARLPDVVVRGKTRDELTVPFVFSGFGIADRMLSSGTELDERRYPLVFFTTAMTEEKVELRISDALGAALKMPPDIETGEKGGCRYERRIRVDDAVLKAVRRRSVETSELPPDSYAALKADLESIELGVRRKPQFKSMGADADRESDVRLISSRRRVHLHTPFSWTVTNSWEKEVLTYAGKKSSAELSFSYNPLVGGQKILSATVSNRNGRVHCVTPKEMNELDAGWVASAPRYPASKRLVVNLPAVETGSVIRVTSVSCVTNSPIAYCNLFSFDSTDPIGVMELSIDGCDMRVVEGGKDLAAALDNVIVTNSCFVAVTNPVPIPREGSQPPSILWRKTLLVSAADLDGHRETFFDALERARDAGSGKAREKAMELADGLETVEARIKAVRDWLWKNIRVAGPGHFTLPFDRAFFPPDRSLEDGYASSADWMNLYFAMLEAIGIDVEFVLSADDFGSHPAIVRARVAVPQPDDFNDLLIRARVREGGWLFGLFGGEEREYILGCENEYTPLGVRDIDGRAGRRENWMSIDLNETGAARITVSNSTWGVSVAALRKRYAEMLPEMRSRHHTELVGEIAESAEAVSALEADVEGYPFVLKHSAYAPNYAARNGDALTLVVPGLGGTFLPGGDSDRKSPFCIGRRLQPTVYVREVAFPEGYTEIEHMPEPWEIVLPGNSGGLIRSTFSKTFEDGRLKITFREEHLPGRTMMFPKDWLGFFRDWNRRTGSSHARTIIVRKPIVPIASSDIIPAASNVVDRYLQLQLPTSTSL